MSNRTAVLASRQTQDTIAKLREDETVRRMARQCHEDGITAESVDGDFGFMMGALDHYRSVTGESPSPMGAVATAVIDVLARIEAEAAR